VGYLRSKQEYRPERADILAALLATKGKRLLPGQLIREIAKVLGWNRSNAEERIRVRYLTTELDALVAGGQAFTKDGRYWARRR
jgi:hypothetical protein